MTKLKLKFVQGTLKNLTVKNGSDLTVLSTVVGNSIASAFFLKVFATCLVVKYLEGILYRT